MRRIVLLPVLLLALLAAAPTAGAVELEEPDESALVEEILAECEADPLCEEEAAEAEAEEEAEAEAASACPLRSAKGHASLNHGKLKVTIGYTTNEPTRARIKLRYGKTKLGSLKRNLGASGVLRFTKALKGKQRTTRLPARIELSAEGAGCPSRRLVLFPK